jgi:hypothetical protein
MRDLSLNEISERVIDAILECRMINKDELRKIIRPILSVWMRAKVHIPKNQKSLNNQIAHEKAQDLKARLAMKNKLERQIEDKEKQKRFYRNELLKIVGDNGIKGIDAQFELTLNYGIF